MTRKVNHEATEGHEGKKYKKTSCSFYPSWLKIIPCISVISVVK